jgi:hypothetical protein
MAVPCSRFRGKLIGALGFSLRGEYIGGRAASGGGPGGLTPWWHGQGLARDTLGCGQVLGPLRLCFGLFFEAFMIVGDMDMTFGYPRISIPGPAH